MKKIILTILLIGLSCSLAIVYYKNFTEETAYMLSIVTGAIFGIPVGILWMGDLEKIYDYLERKSS